MQPADADTPEPTGGSLPSYLISEPAPAKINLYLHVTERYPSGYHGLDSLVVFSRLGDTIGLNAGKAGSGIRLSIEGPFADDLSGEADNLVVRAAHGLAAAAGIEAADVDLTLTKRLPVASGIGGGSADAAAALRALARYWDVTDPAPLFEVAQALGADVPMCLGSRARPVMQVAGIGDEIAAAPALPACHLLLVNPGTAVSTPDVFKARTGDFSNPLPLDRAPEDAADLARELKRRANDLTDAAVALSPEIRIAMNAVAATPDCLLARMSGSGATVFGLFETPGEAETAAGALRDAHPDWWVRATGLLHSPIAMPAPKGQE